MWGKNAQTVYLHESIIALVDRLVFISSLLLFLLFLLLVGVIVKGGAVLSPLSNNSIGMIKHTRLPCLYLPALWLCCLSCSVTILDGKV